LEQKAHPGCETLAQVHLDVGGTAIQNQDIFGEVHFKDLNA